MVCMFNTVIRGCHDEEGGGRGSGYFAVRGREPDGGGHVKAWHVGHRIDP